MKRLRIISILAITATLPAASFAQTANGSLTRAEVRAQTAQAEQNNILHQSKVGYPDSQQNASPHQSADATGYGTQSSGSSESRMSSGHVLSSGTSFGLFSHH